MNRFERRARAARQRKGTPPHVYLASEVMGEAGQVHRHKAKVGNPMKALRENLHSPLGTN